MEENQKYFVYIPYGIKSRREYVNGFGAKEVAFVMLALAIGSVLTVILHFLGMNGLICGLTFLFAPAITAIFVAKDICNTSFLGYLGFLLAFNKEQQVYIYKSLQTMLWKKI